MLMNLNHATGKFHLLSCNRQPHAPSPRRYLIEQIEITSHGWPNDPRDNVTETTRTIRALVGDRAAQCCLAPHLAALERAEDDDARAAMTRAFDPDPPDPRPGPD